MRRSVFGAPTARVIKGMLHTRSPSCSAGGVRIRLASPADRPKVLHIARAVRDAGDAWWWPADHDDAALERYWFEEVFEAGGETFVAVDAADDDAVLGAYLIDPVGQGRRRHVAHGGYMVDPAVRRRRIGRTMGEHSLDEARRRGFVAMQYNCVVSTNEPAVRLWLSLGFDIIGTLPRAFEHPTLGLVDAHVMHRSLL